MQVLLLADLFRQALERKHKGVEGAMLHFSDPFGILAHLALLGHAIQCAAVNLE